MYKKKLKVLYILNVFKRLIKAALFFFLLGQMLSTFFLKTELGALLSSTGKNKTTKVKPTKARKQVAKAATLHSTL